MSEHGADDGMTSRLSGAFDVLRRARPRSASTVVVVTPAPPTVVGGDGTWNLLGRTGATGSPTTGATQVDLDVAAAVAFKVSDPNTLGKEQRRSFVVFLEVVVVVALVGAIAVSLIDPGATAAWSAVALVLVVLTAACLAYFTVMGFKNVEYSGGMGPGAAGEEEEGEEEEDGEEGEEGEEEVEEEQGRDAAGAADEVAADPTNGRPTLDTDARPGAGPASGERSRPVPAREAEA